MKTRFQGVSVITVYHGTGAWAIPELQGKPIRTVPRDYLGGKKAFCTTTNLRIAELFATRRTSAADFLKGVPGGAVLTYELRGVEGTDWQRAKCPGCLQDEDEIAVLNPAALHLVKVVRC